MVNSAPPAGSRPAQRRVSRLLIGTLTVVLLIGATGVAVAGFRRWSAPDDPPCVPASARVRTELDGGDVVAPQISADGSHVLVTHKRELVLLDATTGKVVRRFKNSIGFGTEAVSADGKFVAAHGLDYDLPVEVTVVWATSSGKELEKLAAPGGKRIYGQAIIRSGRQIATATEVGVHLWDVRAGRIAKTLKVDPDAVAVAFSPDSKFLAAASRSGTLAVFDLPTGEKRMELDSGRRQVQTIRISPDGKYVALLDFQGPVTAVELATGRRVIVDPGPAYVADVQFNSDGSSIVTTNSEDKAVRTSLAEGDTAVTFSTCDVRADYALIAPDGKSLVSLEKTADGSGYELSSYPVP